MRYIAQIPLRPYIAALPTSVALADELRERAEELADLKPIGFATEDGQVVTPPSQEQRTAEQILADMKRRGETESWIVRTAYENRVWKAPAKDLSSLREPIHGVFANWGSTPADIAGFTRKYGLLWHYESPQVADWQRGFEFSVHDWQEDQARFRMWWRHRLGAKPRKKLTPRQAEVEAAKAAARAVAEKFMREDRDRFGLPPQEESGPETFLDDLRKSLSPRFEISAGRKGIRVETVAADLWEYMVLLLLSERPEMLRVCENQKCAAPYYIAQRKDQKYCGSDCSQAVATRRWWSLHGNEWRKSRKRKSNGKRGKH